MESVVALTPVENKNLNQEEKAHIDSVASKYETLTNVEDDRAKYADQILLQMPPPETTLLLVDDLSSIHHVDRIKNIGTYTSRAFTRARQGDIVAASLDLIPGYQEYRRILVTIH